VFLAMAGSAQASGITFRPGAPGIGDPYFPLDGNGGYDVSHYDLNVTYDPKSDVLRGLEAIRITAKQNLSSFNLDLHGLTVRTILIDGVPARWSRDGDELTITPRRGIHNGEGFTALIAYDGVPETIGDAEIGLSGFIHTGDGNDIAGQPDAAATWYAVNDHPLDKASYTFRVLVPRNLQVVANGELKSVDNLGPLALWTWDAKEPMASYLTTVNIGRFDIDSYKAGGLKIIDAIDPDLDVAPQPHSGRQMAISGIEQPTYKRLARTINVPANGGRLSFWVQRDTEPNWDWFFVEAHTAGADDWTTLRDLNGHNSQDPGNACFGVLQFNPFMEHYLTLDFDTFECAPTGTTGEFWGASGKSDGYEQWSVDLSPWKGKVVEVALTVATDDLFTYGGAEVDDIVAPQGSTSFERDGNVMDGWTVPGAPEGSDPNAADWTVGTTADTPPTTGEIARGALAQQPQILKFLSGLFGPYPWSTAGGIVDDTEGVGFALETQTRPWYSRAFFDTHDEQAPESVVVHELAHQWTGDSLAVAAWKHIWLNEGFATYTEWLWSEQQGRATAQDFFDFYGSIPADDPFWSIVIGDPGPDLLFEPPVYYRGAMTLHALRQKIGDQNFFRLLKEWIRRNQGGNVAIPQFIALAEQISRQDLDPFFNEWLFTGAKPASLGDSLATARAQKAQRMVKKAILKR
jgi:hypothetical protein